MRSGSRAVKRGEHQRGFGIAQLGIQPIAEGLQQRMVAAMPLAENPSAAPPRKIL
jgi:hypothetical protein